MSYIHHPFSNHIFWTQTWDMCFKWDHVDVQGWGKRRLDIEIFLIKSGIYGHFPCVAQQVLALKQRLRNYLLTDLNCSLPGATLEAPLWVFWSHYCDYIISSIQLIFCLESWNLPQHFYFLSPPVHNCTFLFERLGGTNPNVLLFIKFHGQQRIYQKCEVGGGGRSN